MLKNLKRDGPKKIFNFGFFAAIVTVFLISVSFNYVTKLEAFLIPELTTIHAFVTILLISLFFWLSEITGMIFEFNSFITFEVYRRASSLLVFITVALIFYNILNFNLFLYLITFMYLVEVFFSFYYKDRLNLNN